MFPAIAYNAVDTYIFRGKAPWTLHLDHADHESLVPKSKVRHACLLTDRETHLYV